MRPVVRGAWTWTPRVRRLDGVSTVTLSVTHAEKVEALRALFAREGSPRVGPRHRPAVAGVAAATRTIQVTQADKVAALRGLFNRPGSPQLGAHRPG